MRVALNGRDTEVEDGATIATVLGRLDVADGARGVAVAVDAEVVPRGEWGRHALADGARVEILIAVQGG